MQAGEGLSRDTAEAYAAEDGSAHWLIKTIMGHDNQTAEQQADRSAAARLEVGFNEGAKASNKPKRTFYCVATLTSGSRRLITQDNHAFEISLWTSDGYKPLQPVAGTSVLVRHNWDLQAGAHRTLRSNGYELDAAQAAAAGESYTCRVTYRRVS